MCHTKVNQKFKYLGSIGSLDSYLLPKGDNVAALQMAAKMQPKSKALGIIAREMALDLSRASYAIDFFQHIAGISNGVADVLSRKHQKGKTYQLPSILQYAEEVHPPTRNLEWWLTKPVFD